MSTKTKTGSKRELLEPHAGDKRYVRRKADGTFGKTVELVDRFPSISGRRLKRRFRKVKATEAIRSGNLLDNAAIAELLIREAETERGHRKLAFRRAARETFMWPEEAAHIASAGRSLTELQGIGPTLARRLNGWFESPPSAFESPPIRREFLTLAQARRILAKNPEGKRLLQGDLQMHTVWSDGSGTISAMAEAAIERDYKYIAITDHTKGLKIAGVLTRNGWSNKAARFSRLIGGSVNEELISVFFVPPR